MAVFQGKNGSALVDLQPKNTIFLAIFQAKTFEVWFLQTVIFHYSAHYQSLTQYKQCYTLLFLKTRNGKFLS
jgi:hypothetical protein